MTGNNTRPLQGLRVLDLTVALAGPYATMMLGGLGAEVIRVEAPGGSDIARTNPPFVGRNGISFGENTEGDLALTTLNRSRNKKSVTLNLKTQKGRQVLMRLASQCDILVENMSEGTTVKLGVDYDEIRKVNPQIIYASIKGLGEHSPYPRLKGMDIIVQALSGIMAVTGFPNEPPTRCGIPIADMLAPQYLVNGILSAFIHRARTGEGQHVSVSMLDCLASWLAVEQFDVLGEAGYALRTGNFTDRLIPFGVYETKDGHVAIVAFKPEWMNKLLEAMDRMHLKDDPRFSSRTERMRHADEFNGVIEAWTRQHTCDAIVHELLDKRGVPAAKVRTPDEVLHDEHLHAMGALTKLSHPRYGETSAVGMGLPIQFSKTKSQFDQPAMELGSSNKDIYQSLLGMSDDELQELSAAGVI